MTTVRSDKCGFIIDLNLAIRAEVVSDKCSGISEKFDLVPVI